VIAPIAPNLERVVLTQGGKYYGVHLGPHKSPSKESDPRHLPPNFYYDQQDFIAEIQHGQSWHYTCLRPEAVIGYAEGIPLNTASLVAVYATICRELDVPLNFPGPEAGFNAFNKFIDARLLGRCQVWAATEPKAAGEAFNVGSGDHYSVNRLVGLLGGEAVRIPRRPGEPDITFADITKIHAMLGWRAKVPFDEGVKRMLEHIELYRDAPVWEPEAIAEATADWFRYLGEDEARVEEHR